MADNDMNEVFTVSFEDASVITIPIDDTLSNSGEAADAKAVGDALAQKADRSELQTTIKVNGQAADNQGNIIVTAADTKMSSSDNTTIKAAVEAAAGRTGADIPVDSSQGAQTIKQALASGATRTADAIEMSAEDDTTVKAAIETVTGRVQNAESRITTIEGKTGADIKYQSGSNETIKEHVDSLGGGTVKSVNDIEPDENGNVEIERVKLADNLFTEDAEQVDDTFLIRTTGGEGSLSDGNAWAQKLMGNRTHTGSVQESLQLAVNAMQRTTPPAITASLDEETFETYVGAPGTYVLSYDGTAWDNDLEDYGITITNDPVEGDKITIVWDGETDATVSITAGPRTAPPAITATINRDVWVGLVNNSGTYTFNYTTEWKLSDTTVDIEDYGITITNDPVAGDQIVVVYVKEVRGTIAVANPTALVGTGWNLYDHSKGYARVVKYSEIYGYAISGIYTSIAFAETPTGTTTPITPDSNGLFNVTKDGYIIVTGGNNTSTAIWTTWSDWTEGYSGSWQAYSESSVDISTIMSSKFPYGLLRVGDTRDEIDFVHKETISRISRTAYTDEARAAAAASGRDYEFDENYIYQVRASEIVSSITIDEEYTVSEHGLEYFAGSTVGVYSEITYGANLKDKLKRDVVTISEQTLTSGQKSQVRANIDAVSPTQLDNGLKALAEDIGIVVNGNKTASGVSAAKDQYVILRNSTISGKTDGLYKAAKAIPAATAIDGTYLTAVPGGAANSLLAITNTLNSNINKQVSMSNVIANCNAVLDDGFYSANSDTANRPSSQVGIMMNKYYRNTNGIIQVFYSTQDKPIWFRKSTDGGSTWSTWEEIVLNSNWTNRVYCEVFTLQNNASKTIKYQMFSMTIISTGRDNTPYGTLAYVTRGGVNVIVSQPHISYSMNGDTLTITNTEGYEIHVAVVDLNKVSAPVVIS